MSDKDDLRLWLGPQTGDELLIGYTDDGEEVFAIVEEEVWELFENP